MLFTVYGAVVHRLNGSPSCKKKKTTFICDVQGPFQNVRMCLYKQREAEK